MTRYPAKLYDRTGEYEIGPLTPSEAASLLDFFKAGGKLLAAEEAEFNDALFVLPDDVDDSPYFSFNFLR